MEKIGLALMVFLIVTLITIAFIMWGWSLFMVPVFGLKSLSIFEAFGFSLLTACFKGGSLVTKELLK